MDKIATALKVLGHTERLRILALISRGELTVSELVKILGLSQPRVTQYIKSLEDADIIERLKEGSWVFSRLRQDNAVIASLVATTLAALPIDDRQLKLDFQRLEDVRNERALSVDNFFADVANDRGQLGDEYLPKAMIDAAMRELSGEGPYDFMVDLGTGTGRVLEIFADRVGRGIGIDNNADMLKVARHKLSGVEKRHLTVRQGDLTHSPLDSEIADIVTLHQVLHYLHDPAEAIYEAARLMKAGGILLIVDFEAHNRDEYREKYAHRRLGFSDEDMKTWLGNYGFQLTATKTIENETDHPNARIWRAERIDTQELRHVSRTS